VKLLSTKNLLAKIPFNRDLFNKDKFAPLLSAIMQTRTRRVAFAAAGLAATGGAIAGPILATGSDAHPAAAAARSVTSTTTSVSRAGSVSHAAPTTAAQPAAAAKAKEVASQPRDKEVAVNYQTQTTFYYCAPAATQIAASAQGHNVSQDDLAAQLGTTVNGTNSAEDTTRVLNNVLGSNAYHTTAIPGTPNQAQVDQLQADVMQSLNNGRAVVADIAGATADVTGTTHDFPGGNYLTVIGYHDKGGTVEISDPADENGFTDYWISTSNLANWMATHGYSSSN
jgi:hypothetical protein